MFKVAFHDGGCLVVARDGSTMPFSGYRYTVKELNKIGTKSGIAKLPGAMYRRFSSAHAIL